MEEKNVVFEVTKVGIAVNSKWSVFVDNEYIGKIDFKNSLTKKLPKGKHSVQYKVGLQKTQVLDINVSNEDIIVECVWDGTVRNFHVVGGNDNTIVSDIKTIETQNSTVNEQPKLNNKANTEKAKKPKTALIIILVIIIGAFGGIGLSNIFDGTYNTNTQKGTLDQYAGLWVHYSPNPTGAEMTLTIDGKGNFTEKTTVSEYNRTLVYNGTYKIENDIITLYEDGSVHSQWKIINNNLLRNADSRTLTEYRRK